MYFYPFQITLYCGSCFKELKILVMIVRSNEKRWGGHAGCPLIIVNAVCDRQRRPWTYEETCMCLHFRPWAVLGWNAHSPRSSVGWFKDTRLDSNPRLPYPPIPTMHKHLHLFRCLSITVDPRRNFLFLPVTQRLRHKLGDPDVYNLLPLESFFRNSNSNVSREKFGEKIVFKGCKRSDT